MCHMLAKYTKEKRAAREDVLKKCYVASVTLTILFTDMIKVTGWILLDPMYMFSLWVNSM